MGQGTCLASCRKNLYAPINVSPFMRDLTIPHVKFPLVGEGSSQQEIFEPQAVAHIK